MTVLDSADIGPPLPPAGRLRVSDIRHEDFAKEVITYHDDQQVICESGDQCEDFLKWWNQNCSQPSSSGGLP